MSVTLRDVAELAGVSAATASRALDPTGSASSATRERVADAARRLGYVGNTAARSLRTCRSDTIGLLVPDVRNPFFTDLAYAVDKAASAAGLTVMIGNADEDGAAQDRYLAALERHRIDGLLVVPQGGATPGLRRIVETFPTVAIDRDAGLGVPVVASDSEAGMHALVDHAVALGHRRFAIVAGPQSTSTGRVRLDAARERLAHHDIRLSDGDVIEGDFRLESGLAAARRLLDHDPVPDLVVAADALMALGVLAVIRERGLRPGVDVGLAAFDDNPWFHVLDTPVTVVAQDTTVLARRALDALLRRIAGEDVDVAPIPTTLVVRRSLGETTTVKENAHE
ncbi:LacI family DNA-binding transcriptional regulator [Mobilicoccus pelagius]|uniref:Putative LacI family transcriptional regulator n=1 Tax=Mobilicoccus pelagius NBRC 104925 TaxID=1089455 RepID=H5UVP2_9MICO|nr:LacI family DNA-binding transcriptional regulator [Mobilicoccus pelagius]GAB49800.1 putative LacI family transcriptional regulator [Mobilicoccus pelagius NBRC 104925]